MKIKICGLTSIEDIYIINETKPDYAGFIFVSDSKRKINISLAKEMKSILDKNIKTVGVFVNERIQKIKETADAKVIDIIQLHGNEDNNYIQELKKITNLQIIKALKADKNLKENIDSIQTNCVLIDSYNKTGFGGTGETFNWGLIPKTDKKIFLAGGLNTQNIINAIETVKPYCVDINSGVETNGRKDKQKITEIIQKIKGYTNE